MTLEECTQAIRTKVGADSYANRLTATARAVKDSRTPLQRKIESTCPILAQFCDCPPIAPEASRGVLHDRRIR